MKKDKIKTDDIFEASRLAKEKRAKLARKDHVKSWFAEHGVETLALIVAIVAIIRTF